MLVVFKQVGILFLFAIIGFLLCKGKKINSSHAKTLSTLVVWVFLPATTFKSFSTNFTLKYITERYEIFLTSAISLTVIGTLAYLLSKFFTKDKYRRRVYAYSLTVPNSGYMGVPLTQAIFGDATLLSVLLFALPINIYLYTIGYCFLTKAKLNFKKLINPPLIAIALGSIVGLCGITLPEFALDFLSTASAPMGPCTMLILGMTLSEYRLSRFFGNKINYLICLLRLVVIPFIAVTVFKLIGLEEVILPALIVYSMPCGLNTVVFPKLVNEDCETGAALALLSTAFSMGTIPLMFTLFT
ncbi:MAG: AEC family transporter [Clostridia bacterium]|nr:AEC family transporter [Clostridia bacterium]MBQ4131834.1 AEC family transporter [Clostridia bacterium]